jgi:hypothetical protein
LPGAVPAAPKPTGTGNFLDEWLAKRRTPGASPSSSVTPPSPFQTGATPLGNPISSNIPPLTQPSSAADSAPQGPALNPVPTPTTQISPQEAKPAEEKPAEKMSPEAPLPPETTIVEKKTHGEVPLNVAPHEDGAEDTIYIDREGNLKSTADQPTK